MLTTFICPARLFASLLIAISFTAVMAEEKTADKPPERELSDYELMSVFVEAFEQIESNYVRDVDRRELLEAAVKGMVGHLDQYSNFIPPRRVSQFNQMVEQEFGGIGIQVNSINGHLVVVSPLPETPAYRAGIQSGDIIVSVEGKSVRGVSLSEAVELLQGPVGRPVTIKVVHAGEKKPVEMKLVRQLIKAPTVRGDHYKDDAKWDFMLPGEPRIGLIRISHFSRYTAEEIKSAIEELLKNKMEGLIIDLRGNPGGLLEVAIQMCDLFLEDGNIVSVRGRNVPERSWDAKPNGSFPDFPMAVLVDNYSASASEVFSACMQDNKRAVIIGERTWGKGSVQNVIRMENGESALKLTTASYHRPSGVNIHRFPDMVPEDKWGVTPDEGYLIKLSREERIAISRQRSGRDILRQQKEKVTKDVEEPSSRSTKGDTPGHDKAEDGPDAATKNSERDNEDADDEEVTEKVPAKDRHLDAAVAYIQDQLNGPQIAEAVTAEEPAQTDATTPSPRVEEKTAVDAP